MRILGYAVLIATMASVSLLPAPSVTRAARLADVACATQPPPVVPGAAVLQKRYGGQHITFYAGQTACAQDLDTVAAQQFSLETGIGVRVVEAPAFDPHTYALYSKLLAQRSHAIDVLNLDVTWPGAFAGSLRDLRPALKGVANFDYQTLVANDTVQGRLVAVPTTSDFGMLYYRSDLLRKYHLSVPRTWTELGREAAVIQAGERPKHQGFYGFVFQGAAYEGLTCNALEWIASAAAGHIVDRGEVTLDNPRAVRILDLIRSWVGRIVPPDITTYQEDKARAAFTYGNAAFMRNWPYAWSLLQISKQRNKVGVAALPTMNGGRSSGTAGCCELAVSAYSRHAAAATEFVRYLASARVQAWRATSTAQEVPVSPGVTARLDVVRAMPFLRTAGKDEQRVARPARYFGPRYNQASLVFWTGMTRILRGTPARSVLPKLAHQLQTLVR